MRAAATPLKEAGVDTVVLGCTHYPLIRPILQRVFGRDVTLVFSADETAREVSETLARKAIENDPAREGTYRFLTTGDPARSGDGQQVPAAPDRRRRARRGGAARERGCMSRGSTEAHNERRYRLCRCRTGGYMTAGARTNCVGSIPGLPRAAARLRAVVAGQDARALHGHDRGADPALAAGQGERLDDSRVLAPAGLDRGAHPARRLTRPPRRADGRDPAADRARAPGGLRLRGARRADPLARLRRAPGRRRHPLRSDHRRLRGGLSRARPDGALEGTAALGRRSLGRRGRRGGRARPRLPGGLAGRDGHERRHDGRRAAGRGAGDGRARAVHAGELDQLLELAAGGIDELAAAQREAALAPRA